MKWKFKEYEKDDIQRDSSSEKFFKESAKSDSLIREFIQNSLDANDNNSEPVRVLITEKTLNKRTCDSFLQNLQPHLSACNIQTENRRVRFIVLEDFNTKGLEENNQKDFFYRDNITSKTKGGGSHGIGKAVFYASSGIKTFFGYSIFGNNKTVCLGRSVLKYHKIGQKEYRSDGILCISVNENTDFINKIFTRKKEKGLSVAIPYCDIEIENMEYSCLSQFYMPIINKKLEIEIGGKTISDTTLLQYTDQPNIDINKSKVSLAVDYKTIPKNQIKKYTIKAKDWKSEKIPSLDQESLADQNQRFFISYEIELPIKGGSSEYCPITLLIKKEEDTKDRTIDCWRDSLLITSALGYRKKEKEYSVILLINNNLLSELLRKLEDPGHTRWQTGGGLPDEIREKYENVPGLVRFVKKLPLEILRQIKYPPIDQDSKFFADYFPEASPVGQPKVKKGETDSNMSGGEEDVDLEPIFQDFTFKKNGKGTGFTLRLRNRNRYPDKVTVTTAYGTNIGNAFKNYDKRDFIFGKDITIRANHGAQLSCSKNNVQYSIDNEKFALTFNGFDQDKELIIDIKTEF